VFGAVFSVDYFFTAFQHPEVEGREFVMMDKVVELYDSYKLRRWVYLVLFKDFLLCTKVEKFV
jgi:hypothetical protein